MKQESAPASLETRLKFIAPRTFSVEIQVGLCCSWSPRHESGQNTIVQHSCEASRRAFAVRVRSKVHASASTYQRMHMAED